MNHRSRMHCAHVVVRHVTFFLALVVAARPLGAQQASTPVASPWRITAGIRARAERWSWFDEGGAGSYWFTGALGRLGVERDGRPLGFRVELAAPVLLHLPDDAVRPAPAGALGFGGTYAAANFGDASVAQLFPKNAYVRWRRQWLRTTDDVRVGRFEFNDGTEATPSSETLAAVKRDRITQRLLGTFGWTHVGRSFDGAHWSRTWDGRNITVVAAAPTRGVFQADGWGMLPIAVAYGAWTRPMLESRAEVRLLALQYSDLRDDPVKVDARPLAARQADDERVHVTTVGGHWLQAATGRAGTVDLVLWGALQGGAWGAQSHRAWAGVGELGFQPVGMPSVKPWLRAGLSVGSGDDDPADDTHGTFFQVLPTPRPYARLPFYDMQNTTDAYAILALRPASRFTLRGEAHAIRLTSAQDLWYQGGGAYQMRSFGYVGRPAGGEHDLAHLLDVSAELRFTPDFILTGYLAKARAGRAMRVAYPQHSPGTLAYVEIERRF
jgi:Alginate export